MNEIKGIANKIYILMKTLSKLIIRTFENNPDFKVISNKVNKPIKIGFMPVF